MESKINNVSRETNKGEFKMNNIIGIVILVVQILALAFYIIVLFGGMD